MKKIDSTNSPAKTTPGKRVSPNDARPAQRKAASIGKPGKPERRSRTALRSDIKTRLDNLKARGINDPEVFRKTFIEMALNWEFGDKIVSDPGFLKIIDSINKALADEANLESSFKKLLEELEIQISSDRDA